MASVIASVEAAESSVLDGTASADSDGSVPVSADTSPSSVVTSDCHESVTAGVVWFDSISVTLSPGSAGITVLPSSADVGASDEFADVVSAGASVASVEGSGASDGATEGAVGGCVNTGACEPSKIGVVGGLVIGSLEVDSSSTDGGMTQHEPKNILSPQTPNEVPFSAIQSNVNMQMPDSPVDLLMHISGRMDSTFSVAIIAEDLDVKSRI